MPWTAFFPQKDRSKFLSVCPCRMSTKLEVRLLLLCLSWTLYWIFLPFYFLDSCPWRVSIFYGVNMPWSLYDKKTFTLGMKPTWKPQNNCEIGYFLGDFNPLTNSCALLCVYKIFDNIQVPNFMKSSGIYFVLDNRNKLDIFLSFHRRWSKRRYARQKLSNTPWVHGRFHEVSHAKLKAFTGINIITALLSSRIKLNIGQPIKLLLWITIFFFLI